MTHGEDTVTEIFARRLREDLDVKATAPFSGTIFDLAEGTFIKETAGVRIEKAAVSGKSKKAGAAFEKLVAVGQRLMSVIRKNEGGANKDLDKFAREIQSLCDRYDREE